MDGGHKSERKFPAYTTEQLKAALASGSLHAEMYDKIANEVWRREKGKSVAFVVPQITA